ncbi:MAG: hypothetical protein IJI37_04365, partial [Opitutales bacterium]|nr:hypothetical protein [Opitutales bacterium]
DIIRKHDPKGKIAALALCDIRPKRFELYISDLAKKGKLGEFEWISYHGYTPRPEDAYYKDPETCVDKMIQVLAKYRKGAKPVLRQGENGCPSKGGLGGALTGHPWTECTQAKWDLRRMLGDWGRGIETSVFSISDMHYAPTDSIKIVNVKGLLATDENNQVVKIKPAYYAVQNLAAVFDLLDIHSGKLQPSAEYPEQIEAFGYVDLDTGLPAFTLWFGDGIPTNNNMNIPVDIALKGGAKIENPVWVDILSGGVYEIPEADVSRKGADLLIKAMPLYDSPILITDKSLVDFRK